MTTKTNHHIVAIEAIHCQIPPFTLPTPHKTSIYPWTSATELESRISTATIIITTTIRLTASLLSVSKTPDLQLIVIMASGTDCVDKVAAAERGIPVCNVPSTNIDSVSEHALGLYFSTRRKIVEMSRATRRLVENSNSNSNTGGQETEWKMTGSLKGKMRTVDGDAPLLCSQETMGIIGFGALGSRIKTLATGLGMKVLIAERRGVKTAREGRVLFEDMLKQSTVVVLCLPRTPETENMISTPEFEMMSRRAVLINVARGGIVDEGALVKALREGQIWGAGLDVFDKEPMGKGDSPLLEVGEEEGLNLVLSPHLAWFAERTLVNLQVGVKETVERWAVGDMINRVA